MLVRARVPLVAVVLIALAACGGSGSKKKAAPPPPTTTTTTAPQPTVTVTPNAASPGTKLTLAVSNFAAGDNVTFEIDMPGGRKFTGQPHTIAADGTSTASFLITAQNPAGDYLVRATATKGQVAEGHFAVTAAGGATTTSAVPRATPTSAAPRATTTTTVKR